MSDDKKTVVQKNRVKTLNRDWYALKQILRLYVLSACKRKLIDWIQSLDCDRLEIVLRRQSGVFHLFVKSCHLRYRVRTLHGHIDARVSRETDLCRVL